MIDDQTLDRAQPRQHVGFARPVDIRLDDLALVLVRPVDFLEVLLGTGGGYRGHSRAVGRVLIDGYRCIRHA